MCNAMFDVCRQGCLEGLCPWLKGAELYGVGCDGIVRLGAVHCKLEGAAVKEVDDHDDDFDWHQQACTVGMSNEIQMWYNLVSSPAD